MRVKSMPMPSPFECSRVIKHSGNTNLTLFSSVTGSDEIGSQFAQTDDMYVGIAVRGHVAVGDW